MSKQHLLFSPVITNRRGKNADKKIWSNLTGSSATIAMYQAAVLANKPVLIVVHDTPNAIKLEHELLSLNSQQLKICLFPDWETLPYDSFSPHQDIISQRLATLYQMSRMTSGIIIVPVTTLSQRLAPKDYLESNSLLINKGDKKDLHQLRQSLEASGYRCVDQVMEHGEFSARGAILDIYPMGSTTPYRLDFFDDEIEEIRLFDPENQRSSDNVDKIDLLPAHEFPTDTDGINMFRQQYRDQFPSIIDKESIYHQVSNGILPAGIEYYLPLFFEQTNTLCDFLSDDTLVIISGNIDKALAHYWLDINYRYEDRRYDKTRPLLAPKALFLSSEELYSAIKPFDRITINPTGNTDITSDIINANIDETPENAEVAMRMDNKKIFINIPFIFKFLL